MPKRSSACARAAGHGENEGILQSIRIQKIALLPGPRRSGQNFSFAGMTTAIVASNAPSRRQMFQSRSAAGLALLIRKDPGFARRAISRIKKSQKKIRQKKKNYTKFKIAIKQLAGAPDASYLPDARFSTQNAKFSPNPQGHREFLRVYPTAPKPVPSPRLSCSAEQIRHSKLKSEK